MDRINDPHTVAELTALAWQYERALVTNDVSTCSTALFWAAPEVVRFGATENLYGSDEIRTFRHVRDPRSIWRAKSVSCAS